MKAKNGVANLLASIDVPIEHVLGTPDLQSVPSTNFMSACRSPLLCPLVLHPRLQRACNTEFHLWHKLNTRGNCQALPVRGRRPVIHPANSQICYGLRCSSKVPNTCSLFPRGYHGGKSSVILGDIAPLKFAIFSEHQNRHQSLICKEYAWPALLHYLLPIRYCDALPNCISSACLLSQMAQTFSLRENVRHTSIASNSLSARDLLISSPGCCCWYVQILPRGQ